MKGEDMADNMLIDGLIKFCDEKSKNIKLKAEPQVFVEIKQALEELKAIKQWKSDVMEGFCKYDASSFEEIVVNARVKAIDEFAELMKEKLKDIQFAEFQGIDVCPCAKTGEECPYINQDIGCQYCAREQTIKEIDEIAEKMKAGATNE